MRVLVIAVALVLAPAAAAQPPQGAGTSLQGDQSAWINNSHMRGFYDLTREVLGKGAPLLDMASYRDRSFAIFRAFGKSMGMEPEGMVDHLKDIPGQLVEIVNDDPGVLDSYEKFIEALMGPQ